jgi:hypothetical protein
VVRVNDQMPGRKMGTREGMLEDKV